MFFCTGPTPPPSPPASARTPQTGRGRGRGALGMVNLSLPPPLRDDVRPGTQASGSVERGRPRVNRPAGRGRLTPATLTQARGANQLMNAQPEAHQERRARPETRNDARPKSRCRGAMQRGSSAPRHVTLTLPRPCRGVESNNRVCNLSTNRTLHLICNNQWLHCNIIAPSNNYKLKL